MTTRSRKTAEDSTESAPEGAPPEGTTGDAPEPAPAETDDKGDAADSGTEYLNVTGGPITYSKEGHQIGGGEWTPPVNLDEIGRNARRNGYLLPRSAL